MRKILVIEDDASVIALTRGILEAEKFACLFVTDGENGVKLAQEHLPDLIICDIVMPNMDGYEVLKELQSNPQTAVIPFIFMTAKVDQNDIRQGIELGADDYLTKPFTGDVLLRAVNARFKKQEVVNGHLQQLSDELSQFQQLMNAKDEMLENFNQEVRRPLSNVMLAIEMLDREQSQEQRDRYLQILRDEFTRELSLLNQIDELKKLLTPENVSLLSQFNMLKFKTSFSSQVNLVRS